MPTRKDNTNIAPIYREQVIFPAKGTTLMRQKAKPKINGIPIASGAIDIVSPEFDLLTGVRGLVNMIKPNRVYANIGNNSVSTNFFDAKDVQDAVKSGIREAREYVRHPVVQETVEHNRKLAERIFGEKSKNMGWWENGTKRVTANNRGEVLQHYVDRPVNIQSTNDLPEGWLGDYNSSIPRIRFKSSMSPYDTKRTVFHEGLHHSGFGNFEGGLYDLKAEKLFGIDDYLLGHEAAVHTAELGRIMGLGLGQKYPGLQTFKDMITKYNVPAYDKQFIFNKAILNTPRDYKRLWDALTGKYFTGAGVAGTSLNLIDSDKLKCGGRRKAQLGLDIREGGIAIPIAHNMYYMNGRSHDEGGIGIGPNNKNGLEVEDGEVVKVGKNDVKVFSSVPLLRGVSPAQLVMGGANSDIVFKAQEEFKDRNRINDDGTRYQTGGEKRIYTPSESIQQQLQKTGKITLGGSPIIGAPKTIGYLRNMINLKHINNRAGYPFRRLARYVKGNVNKARDAGEITKEQSKRMKYVYDQVIGENGESLPRTVGLLTEDKQMKFGGSTQDDTKTAALKRLKNKFTIRGNYGGGIFGGAGAGSIIMNQPEFVTDTITKKYLVPVTQTFNDAFKNARNSGQNEFMFNGKLYNTELGDNPNNNSAGAKRTSTIIIPIEHKEIRRKKKKFGGNMIYEINGNIKNTLGSYRPKGQYGLATKYLKKKDKNVEKPIEIKQNNENKILNVRNTTGYKLKQVSQNPWIKYPIDVLSFFLTGAGGKTIQGVKTAVKDIAIKRAFTPSNKNLNKPVDKVTEFINKNKPKVQNNKTIEVGTLENPIKPYAENRTINTYAATENELAKAVTKTAKKQIKPQSIDKIYKKVVGNKEPRSTVGNKPLWTEISYIPTNKPITAYDASVEFHKRISNMLYNDLVKKYGKKGVDKAMKTEHISKYKYGGRIKAENGKFLKYKNGVFTDPKTGEQFDVDPEVFKMYGNTFEEGVIPTADYTKGTFDNARPQFFAEKRIGLFGDKSLAEKAGLARSGWSYGSTPTINYIPDINLSIPEDYGKGVKRQTNLTPRGGNTQAKSISNVNNIPTITSKLKSNDSTYDVSQLGSPATKQAKAKLNTSPTGGETQPNTNEPWIGQYKPITTEDWIEGGANLAGHLASYFMTRNLLDKYPMPQKPVMAPAAKLKTRYNERPEIITIDDAQQMMDANISRNTQSSSTSLARRQRNLNQGIAAKNQVYGKKENIETQLINQDRLNRQTVIGRNIAAYNDWLNKTFAVRAQKLNDRISLNNNLLSGMVGSVTNMMDRVYNRKAINNNIRAIAAANPNVDARLIGGFDTYVGPGPDGKRKALYDKNQKFIRYIDN